MSIGWDGFSSIFVIRTSMSSEHAAAVCLKPALQHAGPLAEHNIGNLMFKAWTRMAGIDRFPQHKNGLFRT